MDQIITVLDEQMRLWGTRLRDDLNVPVPEANAMASVIRQNVTDARRVIQAEIIDSSPVPIHERLEMIGWGFAINKELMEFDGTLEDWKKAARARAHTISMCYLAFAYVSDTLLDIIIRVLDKATTAWKCAVFLRSEKRRAFRNAFAHGNWLIRSTGDSIDYWALEKMPSGEPKLVPDNVTQHELVFWYALSRCLAFAALDAVAP